MEEKRIEAPIANRIPKKLEIHNHVRIDDYYWLNERENPEVMKYLKEENAYVDQYFKPIDSFREKILEEMKSRIKKDDNSVPYKLGDYEYFYKYNNEQQYPVYCRKKKEGNEEVILDVNELAKGNDYCSVVNVQPSPDHKLLSYSIDLKGRRIYSIKFRELETGKDLEDKIEQVTSNHCWANDNSTIFYTSKDLKTLRSNKIFRHKLGESVEKDVLLFEETDETFSCYVSKTLSKKYIFIVSRHTDRTEYRVLEADNPLGEFQVFLPREGVHEYSLKDGVDRFYIVTNDNNNKNFKLVEAPLKIPTNKSEWKDVVAHRDDVLLESTTVLKDWIVVDERKNSLLTLRCINRTSGESHVIDFGEEVYDAGTSYISEYDTILFRYSYQSLTTPVSTYQYNLVSREKVLLKEKEVVGKFDKNDYVTKRLWVPAYTDKTLIPVSVVHRRDVTPSKDTPLFLYGYGSYGISIDPYFSSNRLSILDRGFIFVIAHIRGGEEMGRKWYEDGKMMKKMNTFTDFISCAQYLVDNNYTSPQKLFVSGGSAGGLLIGAVINMRPDLFKGAILDVPFVDVVTTMLDDSIPLTTGEYTEWGNPNEKEAYYYMLSYSPYDNIVPQNYPNLLFLTGFEDSQVQYFEPAKHVAKLRRVKTDDNVLLFKTDLSSGHSGATGRFKELEDIALKFAWVLHLAGINN